MSHLSEYLSELLEQRGLSPAQFSSLCPLERSTLYQYLTGRRPLHKKEHLLAITKVLQLTPAENKRMTEAFQMEQLGLPLYQQRKAFGSFLFSFKDFRQPSEAFAAARNNALTATNAAPKQGDVVCVQGEVEVKSVVFSILKHALLSGEPVDIILQPEQENLLQALYLYGACPGSPPIRHIICMESDVLSGRCHNLSLLQQTLKYSICCKNYTPLYYYGRSSERFGCTNLLPGLILTGFAAVQLSADAQSAMLYTYPNQLAVFRRHMDGLIQNHVNPLSEDFSIIQANSFPRSEQILRLTSDLCIGNMLTEELCREYLNPAIPDYERTLQGIIQETAATARYIRSKKVITYMDPVWVRKFLEDGFPLEYPSYLYAKPFSKESRRYFVEQKLAAAKKGHEKFYFFREGQYPMDRSWQLGVFPGEKLQLNHISGDTVRVFDVTEAGITATAADYLQALADSPQVLSAAASEQLLFNWSREYLEP